MQSNILVEVTKKTVVEGREVFVKEFATDQLVFAEMGPKKTLFVRAKNQLFIIDERNYELVPINKQEQLTKVEGLRETVKDLQVMLSPGNGDKQYRISSDAALSSNSVNGEVNVYTNELLSRTAYPAHQQWSQAFSIAEVDLQGNEVIKSSKMALTFNGNSISSETTIESVESINSAVNRFDHFSSYPVA